MRQGGPRSAVALVGISVALALAASGRAHDSLAPPDAPHAWLPPEAWVRGHWIPFEEQELKRALGLHGRDLEAYLYNDHHTLARLARLRGIGVDQLADRLLAPWRQSVSSARMALLRDHTIRIITEGHLAQHVFFHIFHGIRVQAAAPSIFGMSSNEYRRLRELGLAPLSIARRGGVHPAAVRRGMIELFRARHDAGIRKRLAWPPESDRILRRQMRALPCWLRRPGPPHDPGNPYGKARLQHGDHRRGWPHTARERRREERRVERLRRSLPASCWRRPPAWKWPAHPRYGR
jgi:hypothetical protein